MNIGFYVIITTGKKRCLIAGPYRTQEKADTVLPKYANLDVSNCPGEFITTLNYDYPEQFITVGQRASRDELPASWLGNKSEVIQQEGLFQ